MHSSPNMHQMSSIPLTYAKKPQFFEQIRSFSIIFSILLSLRFFKNEGNRLKIAKNWRHLKFSGKTALSLRSVCARAQNIFIKNWKNNQFFEEKWMFFMWNVPFMLKRSRKIASHLHLRCYSTLCFKKPQNSNKIR